jgi:hypothetical protein
MRRLAFGWWFVLVLACSSPSDAPEPGGAASLDANSPTTCEDAFHLWVEGAASLNSPEVDLEVTLGVMETVQRRVFELCSLAEAERYNHEILWEPAQGISQPLIETDFRTFAEIECVDESPLLDGTSLCAEVAP